MEKKLRIWTLFTQCLLNLERKQTRIKDKPFPTFLDATSMIGTAQKNEDFY